MFVHILRGLLVFYLCVCVGGCAHAIMHVSIDARRRARSLGAGGIGGFEPLEVDDRNQT